MTDARRALDAMIEPSIDNSIVRAFRHLLREVDVEDAGEVFKTVWLAGESYSGNRGAIEAAIHEIRQLRSAA